VTPKKPNTWGRRTFTPQQWLKRDIRSAQTRSAKKGKPTLATVRFDPADDYADRAEWKGRR